MNIYNYKIFHLFSYCFQTYLLTTNIYHTCKWNFLRFVFKLFPDEYPKDSIDLYIQIWRCSCNRTKKTHKQVHAPCRNRDDDGVEGGGSSGGSGGDYERVSAAVQFLFSPGRPSPLSWQLSPPLLPWLN